MGGLKVNELAEVLNKDGPIPGLFGAGEVNGGIHGQNRLGGSSLLEAHVLARVWRLEALARSSKSSSSPAGPPVTFYC